MGFGAIKNRERRYAVVLHCVFIYINTNLISLICKCFIMEIFAKPLLLGCFYNWGFSVFNKLGKSGFLFIL